MSTTLLLIRITELIIGILMNVFMEKITKLIFRKDGTAYRLPIRVLGIYLIINSILIIYHAYL